MGREDYWIFCCYLFCFLISVEDVCIPFPSCVMSHSDRRPCCTLCQYFRSSRFFCFLIKFLKWHLFAFHYMRVCELESHDQACGGQRPTCVSCSLLPSRIACDWRQTPGLAARASTPLSHHVSTSADSSGLLHLCSLVRSTYNVHFSNSPWLICHQSCVSFSDYVGNIDFLSASSLLPTFYQVYIKFKLLF